MLDIKWIRENREAFVKGLTDRGFDEPEGTLTQILSLDEQRRSMIAQVQAWQEQRNRVSKEIGFAKKAGDEARVTELMGEMTRLKSDITNAGEDVVKRRDDEFNSLLAAIPNIPADDVPVGPDAGANKVLREVGKKPDFKFAPRQHFELGEALGLMDFETAAKLSGARFVVLKGPLARLERALAQFMLDLHTSEHGYTEINPPLLVRDDTMFGTAQLPKFREDQYLGRPPISREVLFDNLSSELKSYPEPVARMALAALAGLDIEEQGLLVAGTMDDYVKFREQVLFNSLWLIPTAEVPLTNLVREDIVDEGSLPLRYTAWTPCFRAEAGAAGKDTRGMIRQHQFSKVELVSITTPEQSSEEHERMTEAAETVLKRLEIPYRVVTLSTGDMGFAARKTYDLEVWLPGQGAYREISSCSNCGDFQARRMKARYRPKNSKDSQFVHTLNGSGVAVGRALIAVLENYQEADGSIRVPAALVPYMGGLTKIAAPS